jgi:BirA family biotin operon repressor/biotin-[acetyl-CoA-carboxylase] ligase
MSGLPDLPAVYRLTALDRVDSTNEEAKRLARDGAPDGTLVWARAQSAGKGRSGNAWTSPRGNLYVSLVLRAAVPQPRLAELGFVAAVALGAALDGLRPPAVPLRFKWPNDVLLRERKLAGILVETESAGDRPSWAVLGVGVNIARHPEGTELAATSLHAEGEKGIPVEGLLAAFAGAFLDWRLRWEGEGFAPVAAAWKARARGIGEPIRVRLPRGELRGTFTDLDADGALLLDQGAGGVRRVTAGDVFFG